LIPDRSWRKSGLNDDSLSVIEGYAEVVEHWDSNDELVAEREDERRNGQWLIEQFDKTGVAKNLRAH
jgi:hypothetical protein